MMKKKENIIAINGSTSKKGTTVKLLKQLNVPIVHLVDGISKAYRKMENADIVIFGTPTYWFNMSALMKEFIEYIPESPYFPCEGKIAFFVAVCNEDGAQQAISQMMTATNHMGFKIPPYASYFYNIHMAKKSENKWQFHGMKELKERLRFKNVGIPRNSKWPGYSRSGKFKKLAKNQIKNTPV